MKNEDFKNHEKHSAIANTLLELALAEGATHAQVNVSHSTGLSLRMRQGSVRSRTRETHSGYTLTVFNGFRQGSVNSTDLTGRDFSACVKAACAIAEYTGEDDSSGPANASLLCNNTLDLDLFHSWDLDETAAVQLAQKLEAGLAGVGAEVQSEGAWVESSHALHILATTEGFNSGVALSQHSLGINALARSGTVNELDMWSETLRDPKKLSAPEVIGRVAAARARAYLDQQGLSSRVCPVLFDPSTASSLLGHLSEALSDHSLYTGSSFLIDRLGEVILADHLSLYEDPHISAGMGSMAFDSDGIAPRQRTVIGSGVLNGYFLSLYGARRLGLPPTGNGYGPTNLKLTSTLTQQGDNFEAMLMKLGTGLLVTSLAGNGVRMITGDYSRGARGFWVENGVVQYAVTGITISGNLTRMLREIICIGNDELIQGSFCTGSILIDQMQISGR